MSQTLVRVFFNDDQVLGIVTPDHDHELDQHHKSLVAAPHRYVDLTNEEYRTVIMRDGMPDIYKLHRHVKTKGGVITSPS